VVVGVEPNSRAADAGLRPGDILVELDGKPLSSVDQVQRAAKGAKQPLLFGVRRGSGVRYVAVQP
jgi:S1-C subfamily serine protease